VRVAFRPVIALCVVDYSLAIRDHLITFLLLTRGTRPREGGLALTRVLTAKSVLAILLATPASARDLGTVRI
jgi:hypothetical protein